MKATQTLHEMGQSLWLDNLTRGLLTSGSLRRYIQEFSVTGLTSNPTMFDHAIKNSDDYHDAIRQKVNAGKSGEALFFELALVAALEPDDVVLGGGNVHKLRKLPPGCRAGENANAFRGGLRLWEEAGQRKAPGNRTLDQVEGRQRT